MQIARKGQETLTCWTDFQKALSAKLGCQKGPRDTHKLDKFSRGFVRNEGHQKGPGDTHKLDTFLEGFVSHTGCQKGLEDTHLLHFQQASAMQVARKGQETLTCWTHF